MKMSNTVKVSIVVPIYNVAKYLDKLITSIINQSYPHIEIILVDDGSPDSSGLICDNYAKQDSRIIVIHKKNAGGCEARNTGLDIATGEYIMFIDGDDWISTDCVEYLLNIAILTNSDMALSDANFTTRDQQQIKHDNIGIWTSEQAISSILYPRFSVGCWNKIYKLSLIKKHHIRFDVPWSGEGMYFATMAANFSNQVGYGHRKVYHYRMNNKNSAMTNYNVQIGINALYNIKNIKKKLTIRTPKVMHSVHWHIWKNYNFLLRLIISTQSIKKNLELFLKCLVMIRFLLPYAIIGTEFPLIEKINFIKRGVFPIYHAIKLSKKQKKDLDLDKME